jgi:hypothetical protein
MSLTNYDIRARWPECYSKGLLEMRECQPVPARLLKSTPLRRKVDPDVKKADKGDDHTYVQKITGAYVHEYHP